jgi:4'-phosphopantetheinyl transferase
MMTDIPTLTLPLLFDFRGALFEGCLTFARVDKSGITQLQPNEILHPRELARLNTYTFEARRKSFLGGRIAAKQALAHLLKTKDPRELEIASGVFDQPITQLVSDRNIEVSITHCKDFACAAAFPAGFQIGIDLESISRMTAEKREAVRDQFTEAELQCIDAQNTAFQDTASIVLWSMKECLSKSLKCGMTTPFTVLETTGFTFDPLGKSTCRFKNFSQYVCTSVVVGEFVLSITSSIDMTIKGVDRKSITDFLSAF